MKTLHMILISLVFGMGQGTVVAHAAEVKLTASDAAAGDEFGYSVSISGDYVIVGAPGDDHAGESEAGSAYIFIHDETGWSQQAKLTASDAAAGDGFGGSVSISGDYGIVGASGDDDPGNSSGSAYIFKRNGTTWTEQAKLTASDAAAGDGFGVSVSISGDYAIVGASGENSAYIFMRDGTGWTEQAKLTVSAPDAAESYWFRISVSISGDYAIVGASGENSAYIFMRDGTGWTEQAKLAGGRDTYFGWSVSISGDYAIVGNCCGWDIPRIFYRNQGGSDKWGLQAGLIPTDGEADELLFGYFVSISGDYVMVGAPEDNPGSAYFFLRSDSFWSEIGKVTPSDALEGDWWRGDGFAESVSISGEIAIVGDPWDDHAGEKDVGSAYIYHSEVSVSEEKGLMPVPDGYALQRSYPNPFNPITTIRYQLPEPGDVRLAIYDLLGQEVRVLVSERQPVGWYRVRWDGRDEAGQLVSSGVYFYRLDVEEEFLQTRKLTVVR